MLVMYDHAVTQCRYAKGAMDQISSFRPDGKSPTAVGTLISGAATPRSNYITAQGAITDARIQRVNTIQKLHDGCVDFTAQARSRFRKDPAITARLNRLPTDDKTFQQTITRADLILAFWPGLPDVELPDATTGPFTFGSGADNIDLDTFTNWRADAVAADEAIAPTDQAFQKAEADLHKKMAELEDFSQAAITNGTSRYNEGTAEREIIDAIPTDPPQHAPGDCEITDAVATGSGGVHLECESEFATGFDVFDLAPGATDPVPLLDDEIGTEFDLTGLAPGSHTLTARGRNAKGPGPMSAGVVVVVT